MGNTQEARYQLGTARISGRERIVLSSQGMLFDLFALLDNRHFWDMLAIEGRKLPSSLLALIESWSYWKDQFPGIVAAIAERQRSGAPFPHLEQGQIEWLPPLMYPRKLICIGTNYHDHVAEMAVAKLPRAPYSFLKPPTTTLIGSGQPLHLPEQARFVDWEAELAVVIATGTPAGVGFGKKPPEVLHPGDTMVVEIEGPGRLETPVMS